jgi:hypothetical protein
MNTTPSGAAKRVFEDSPCLCVTECEKTNTAEKDTGII